MLENGSLLPACLWVMRCVRVSLSWRRRYPQRNNRHDKNKYYRKLQPQRPFVGATDAVGRDLVLEKISSIQWWKLLQAPLSFDPMSANCRRSPAVGAKPPARPPAYLVSDQPDARNANPKPAQQRRSLRRRIWLVFARALIDLLLMLRVSAKPRAQRAYIRRRPPARILSKRPTRHGKEINQKPAQQRRSLRSRIWLVFCQRPALSLANVAGGGRQATIAANTFASDGG